MLPENVRRKVLPTIGGLVYVFVLLYIIRWLQLSTLDLILFLTLNSAIFFVITKRKQIKDHTINGKQYFKHVLQSFVTITIFVILIKYLGGFGVIGLFLIVILMVLFKLIKNKKQYFEALKTIETMIWQKPLDKDQWNKGEFKNTKVKMVWRKKNENR